MRDLLLVIDVGNTNIVLGVFEGDSLLVHWRLTSGHRRTEDEMAAFISQLFSLAGLDTGRVMDVAVSCVVPPALPVITGFCRKMFGRDPLVVGPGVKTGVTINIDNPKEAGADRIVNAVAALEKYDPPLILVDFGTAITIDVVSAKAEYMWGAIVPGARLSLNALYHHAARLPEVEFSPPPSVIGRNTVHSMQSGAYYGYTGLVDGIVERMKKIITPKPKVIATGGEAELIAPASSTIEIVEENLTLEGLRVIYKKNRK